MRKNREEKCDWMVMTIPSNLAALFKEATEAEIEIRIKK